MFIFKNCKHLHYWINPHFLLKFSFEVSAINSTQRLLKMTAINKIVTIIINVREQVIYVKRYNLVGKLSLSF